MTSTNSPRIAIVTGGGNGIGRATALMLAEAGYAVAVWDLAEQATEEVVSAITAAGGVAIARKVDVSKPEDCAAGAAAVVERFGRIDVLINNAGVVRDGQLVKVKDGQVVGQMSAEQFQFVLDVCLKGVFNCTQAVVPTMIAQKYGRIVSTSSVVALYGNFGQTNYVAAKAGVIGMTRVWARELGRYGITANAIAPGFIATAMVQSMPEKVLQSMIDHTPVGRAGQPDDIARAFAFLADEKSSFINGAVLSVDGGSVLGT
ncbi:3-oxoacyl-ACP reductase FabG [Nannocystis bainbridge]|uniref:3-oxoacyl-ACP reductase FabG n=1 Tax=Nannocystis bainbridge TaxID=2995303 RepID=A0ABT5E061_9BACT|nr:3-oxoacyl-ACP reductase FabG [Nannocystis bainbridge]MDC0719196.1 3-oxoacyl-ACP reductase FabG [Nannocystis bainbridge]